jgi:hypothetical protein
LPVSLASRGWRKQDDMKQWMVPPVLIPAAIVVFFVVAALLR